VVEEPFYKVRSTSARDKNCGKFLSLNDLLKKQC